MKFPNIDMHQPIPLWIPITMIALSILMGAVLTYQLLC